MTNHEIVVVSDPDALARVAARRFEAIARDRVAQADRFTVALSGGSTPRALFQLLAEPPYQEQIDWSRTHVFWGDERSVPPDAEESNYRMAREALLDHVSIPASQIHRIEGERDPVDAAERYEYALLDVFGLSPGTVPTFDLVLLGIGDDGHTASLFPDTDALDEHSRLVVANPVPQLRTTRVTLTPPVLQQATNILVLVAGTGKAAAVQRALEGPFDSRQTPAQLLRGAAGTVTWLLDRAAAQLIQQPPEPQ